MTMLLRLSGVLAAALLLVAAPAMAELEPAGRATVAEIVDGDTVRLVGGREVRLVGLQAPKLPLGRRGFQAWPLAEEAKAALEEIAGGRAVALATGGAARDRHGRVLAHLERDDGLWVQGAMLRRGLARVYTFADNRARAAGMLALEAEARAARRGIWGHPFYAVRPPERTADAIDTFQLVEGRVLKAAEVRGRLFLNFGADWRQDFTVSIEPAVLRRFRAEGFEPLALEGRTVRVRGWLKSWNGPLIEATHPEQIEGWPGR